MSRKLGVSAGISLATGREGHMGILTHGPRDHGLLNRWFLVSADGNVSAHKSLYHVPVVRRGDFVHWSLLDEDTRSLIWWSQTAPGARGHALARERVS
jgi:hypothetical protein